MNNGLGSTYGVWLVSLFIETMLFGAGALQAWIYFFSKNNDTARIKSTASVLNRGRGFGRLIFFFLYRLPSSCRLISRICAVSDVAAQGRTRFNCYLLCDHDISSGLELMFLQYLSAFCVQLSVFNTCLTRGRKPFSLSAIGMYFISLFALLQVGAGIAQVIASHQVRFYAKLDSTKAWTLVSSALFNTDRSARPSRRCKPPPRLPAILGANVFEVFGPLTVVRCRTNYVIDRLMYVVSWFPGHKHIPVHGSYDAINCGTLTSLASAATMILFLAVPDTFWFFLGLAPSSKLYMNSMLATLNTRSRLREHMTSQDKGWNSISMETIGSSARKRLQVQVAVDHEADMVRVVVSYWAQDWLAHSSET
ncbi:unnamed protein product [Mycena citricolor]|uniref:DUF6534 domain-containing protein n=1 Tax=Mycena citricolor TaxID=2018698 RepID=A0AAD2HCY2_9AGAR|nr:unnamed protein product [Mycena citricolor]CAK5273337.1 unnamed protein product [Mycena citricolor]